MSPKKMPQLRYLQAVNKAHLAKLAAAGVLVVLPACGNGDKQAFSSTTLASTTVASETTIPAETLASVAESSIPVTTLASQAGPAVPASTEMTVNLTYTASGDGMGPVRNPYIAVWVEDRDGNLIQTISVWFQQSQRGQQYLEHLTSWFDAAVAANKTVTTSGASRAAGTYSVAWDGKDDKGNALPQGTYTVRVEVHREFGDHVRQSGKIECKDKAATTRLEKNSETAETVIEFKREVYRAALTELHRFLAADRRAARRRVSSPVSRASPQAASCRETTSWIALRYAR